VSRRYAAQTTVPPERSRAEIERTLGRYGASQFMYGWDTGRAVVAFRAHEKNIRFILPLPDREDFTHTSGRSPRRRTQLQVEQAWQQASRQRWRALALAIKSKLETVESGIATFEDEFLAYIVLPNGQTVGEFTLPQIEQAYATGLMPRSLPGLPAGQEEES
jgi:hypothetical protein